MDQSIKVSKLIKCLNQIKATYGDVNVAVESYRNGGTGTIDLIKQVYIINAHTRVTGGTNPIAVVAQDSMWTDAKFYHGG